MPAVRSRRSSMRSPESTPERVPQDYPTSSYVQESRPSVSIQSRNAVGTAYGALHRNRWASTVARFDGSVQRGIRAGCAACTASPNRRHTRLFKTRSLHQDLRIWKRRVWSCCSPICCVNASTAKVRLGRHMCPLSPAVSLREARIRPASSKGALQFTELS